MATPSAPVRVLVVDDSAVNRRNIGEILSASSEIQVIGKAADGEEALRLVNTLRPDAITLDLEMPKMDGFTFLRILMSSRPTPVVVVSSYSQKENVFKALELGALDFVAKPDSQEVDPDAIREQLVSKVLLARSMKNSALVAARHAMETMSSVVRRPKTANSRKPPRRIIAIASSTGGPSALMEVLSRIPGTTNSGIVIAQHMPDKFTRTFSERLNKRSNLEVAEARELDEVGRATAFVCPGRKCMEMVVHNNTYRLTVSRPAEQDRYVPSADRLFASVAKAVGKNAVGVILTGMGDDGVAGARKIVEAGGTVIAESESTAVVYGMPGAAVRAGVVSRSLPLPELALWLAQLDA